MDIQDIFSNPVKVKWEEVAPLPVGRAGCIAVLLHGSVYVGAGLEGRSANDYQGLCSNFICSVLLAVNVGCDNTRNIS